MGLHDDFNEALHAVGLIDFSTCALRELNVFETIIRYMGGLLGAYDLSGASILLEKAIELGDMVYKAFDTPNRMPITRWDFQAAKAGDRQIAPDGMLVAEIGSLTLEMTRLSQLTGDNKYYDAVERIMVHLERQQQETGLPGLFAISVNPRDLDFRSGGGPFTLGGMVDSIYEYLPKAHLLSHGGTDRYRNMYSNMIRTVEKHLVYQPMAPETVDVRLVGQADVADGRVSLDPQNQHLTCFVGGMVGLGARAFEVRDATPSRTEANLDLARKLTNGCIWGYDVMPLGIMPEIMHSVPCDNEGDDCTFDENRWLHAVRERVGDDEQAESKVKHLPKGLSSVDDTRYGLRPEAIESVFVLYRLTGDTALRDKASSISSRANHSKIHILTHVT